MKYAQSDLKEKSEVQKAQKYIEKVKKFIGNDNQWVAELFELVRNKSEEVFKKTNIASFDPNDESTEKYLGLYYSVTLWLFGIILTKIITTNGYGWLNHNFSGFTILLVDEVKGKNIKVKRHLLKENISVFIDELFIIPELLLDFIKSERKFFFENYMDLFNKNTDLKMQVNRLLNATFSNKYFPGRIKKSNLKRGPEPLFKCKQDLIEAINNLPEKKYKSQTKLAQALNMSEGNLRRLRDEFELDLSIYLTRNNSQK